MDRSLLSLPRTWVSRLLGREVTEERINRLYAGRDYLDAYSKHTDLRVRLNPHSAIGGMWEEIGRLQFDFLVGQGLKPEHRMLDIGCGTLRGGRHFIRYLDVGGYTGMDISPKAIRAARKLVKQEGLKARRPRLLISTRKDLQFTEFDGGQFDYILAQSVFTHLQAVHIEECFAHIGRVMGPHSRFFFTYNAADERQPEAVQHSLKDFGFRYSFFRNLAERNGFRLQDLSMDYPHPRNQRMAMLARA